MERKKRNLENYFRLKIFYSIIYNRDIYKVRKIIVLATWDTPKEKTWSGTTYALTMALKKYYDIEIKDLRIGNVLRALNHFSAYPFIGMLFGYLYTILLEYRANKIIGKDKSVPVFEICQCVKVKNPFFSYQDMTWECGSYTKELKQKYPFIWFAAGNNTYHKGEMDRRIKHQNEIYALAKAVPFMSRWVAEFTKKKNPNLAQKIFNIGGGANTELSKINLSQKKGNKFLFVGRDFYRKAGDLVIEAFKIIRDKYSEDFELHIAGPKDLNISEKNIFVYGDADKQTVTDLMNRCDVFVMPSRFEAYGLVFAEALIHGMPCIARNLFEMPYFIKDHINGKLIVNDDAEELALAMYSTIKNKDMIDYVIAHQADYLNQYSWNAVARRLSDIINKEMNYN